MSSVNENLQTLFSKMEEFISTKVVVGDAVQFGNVTVIPLVEVSFGVGTALSDAKTSDKLTGGGGLGAKVKPAAIVVIVNDTVQLISVKNKESVNQLIDLIPGVLSKFNLDALFSKKDKEEMSSNSAAL